MIELHYGAGDLTTANPSSNDTVVTVNKPANIADGDLLIAAVFFQNGGAGQSITPPAGWVRLGPAIAASPHRPSGFYALPVPVAADVSETSWTWSTNVLPGRRRGMIFRATGVDLDTPEDSHGSWAANDGTASVVLPEVVVTTQGAALLAMIYTNNSAGSGYPAMTPPPPMESIATVNTPVDANANSALWAGFEMVPPNATGTRTVTMSPSATNSSGYMVALKEAGAQPVPIIVHNIVGDIQSDSFQVAYRSENVVTGVRIVASVNENLSNPLFSPISVPDSDGYGHAIITGLSNDTLYYWALEVDGVVSPAYHGRARTLARPGSRASFSFLAASCVNTNANPVTLDNMRLRVGQDALPARFFAHLGDFHYVYSSGGGNPVAPDDPVELRNNYSNQIVLSRQHQLFRDIPLSYTWSDVDSFGSNGDGTYAANGAANIAYRQVFPLPSTMPETTGLYRSWVIGRVLFIQSDMRTFASSKSATDNASKTKLGSVQKAWMLDLINNSKQKLIIWLGDSAWFGPTHTDGNNDAWTAYNTERVEVGNAIQASGKNLIYIHGDVHSLAADDGSNNQWGGFPIACAAPIARPDMNVWPSGSTWTVSQGSFPPVQQAGTAYGWFEVTDSGQEISLRFRGINAEIEQVSMLVTWRVGGFATGGGTGLAPRVLINGNLVDVD